MTKITFFEFHLDGAEFMANAPGSGQEETEDDEEPAATDADGSGAGPLLALVSLVLVVGVALAVKKLLGGGDDLPPVESEA